LLRLRRFESSYSHKNVPTVLDRGGIKKRNDA
jgi:hypothetical protein